MIRAIHDVKGIDMGSSLVRYKVGRRLHQFRIDDAFMNEMISNYLIF